MPGVLATPEPASTASLVGAEHWDHRKLGFLLELPEVAPAGLSFPSLGSLEICKPGTPSRKLQKAPLPVKSKLQVQTITLSLSPHSLPPSFSHVYFFNSRMFGLAGLQLTVFSLGHLRFLLPRPQFFP